MKTIGSALMGVLSLLLISCGGSTRSRQVTPLAPAVLEADLGLAELRKSLESTVLENYAQLSYGNVDALLDGVAMERELQVIGVTPKDVWVGVSPQGMQRDRRLYRHRAHEGLRILSKNLDVHLSADGSVGWIYDEISYRVVYMGREASIPIRVTSVYVRDVERWAQVAEHMSYGVPVHEIVSLEASGKLASAASFKTSYGSSKELSAFLVGLIGTFLNSGLAGNADDVTEDVLILLPGAEQEFHGSESTQAPALAALFASGAAVGVRDVRVQVSPSKRMSWIIANLVVRTEVNGDAMEIVLRGSFVLERRRESEWSLVQAHVSAPLQERQVSERVFGPTK